MRKAYIIPDPAHMEISQKLAGEAQAGFEYNDFFLPEMLDDKKKQMERINAYSKVRSDFSGDTMHGAFLDVTIHSQDLKIREISKLRMCQSMDIAKEMNLRGVVFHTGRLYNFRDVNYLKNWLELNEQFLRVLLEQYPKQEIWLENMFDEAPDVLAELAERMRDCPGFGICFDYAHAVIYGGNPEEWFQKLAPFIRHIHINDNDLKGDLHQSVGSGKLNWELFQEQILHYKLEASVLIEVNGEEKQKKSIEYMKQKKLYPY
ncbi:MAG: sugar phosphate isomerase/epimerase family protein [Roseburia sp.]